MPLDVTNANMNKLVLSFVLITLALCTAEQYTDRYDDLDIDEILQNKRLLSSYVKCILDQGRCTPEGKEIKLHIVDGMQTSCEKCTNKQQVSARQILKHIRAKEPQYWEQVIKKYDPKDEYKENYESFLASED